MPADSPDAKITNRRQDERPAPVGYRTQALDTTYEVDRYLVQRWREMSIDDKARLLRDCCRMVDEMCRTGLRLRHPDASDRELFLRAALQRLGPTLALEVYEGDPLLDRILK
jgi:hypothetical protein